MLSQDQVLSLKKGDILYNNIIWGTKADGDTVPYKAKVLSVPKKGGKDQSIKIKRLYGNHGEGSVSVEGRKLWRLTEERTEEDKNLLPTAAPTKAPRRVVVQRTPERKASATATQPAPTTVEVATPSTRRIVRPRKGPQTEMELKKALDAIDNFFK